jgi:hypothetical protein
MLSLRLAALLAFVILSALVARTRAADSPPVPPDVPPALAPAESRKALRIADGLGFELVASEPTVQQPLSITLDDRGRLWVLQYLQYPIPNGLKALEVDRYLRTKYDYQERGPWRRGLASLGRGHQTSLLTFWSSDSFAGPKGSWSLTSAPTAHSSPH